MTYRPGSAFPAGHRLQIALPREVAVRRRSPFTMEMLIGGLSKGIDKDSISKMGTLTKKDIFRWSLDFRVFPKPNITRSDYFKFGPTPSSMYYLISNIYDSNSTYFTVGLCRFVLPGCIPEDVSIKVSFSLMDTRDRCHYPSEKLMNVGVESVEASFDRHTCTAHNSMFFFNNSLRIQCSLDVEESLVDSQTATKIEMPINDVSQDLTTDLRSLLQNGQHSDVVLNLTGQEFKAHRSILAARSSVFAAMFDHDTLEKQQNRIDIVDITGDTMGHLLSYLYTGETEELSTQEFLSLFVAADKYNLPKLKKRCSSCISPKITSDTALSVLTLAYLHQDNQLKSSAIDAVLDNALKVMKSDEWLVFLREYSELANSVILKLASRSQLS